MAKKSKHYERVKKVINEGTMLVIEKPLMDLGSDREIIERVVKEIPLPFLHFNYILNQLSVDSSSLILFGLKDIIEDNVELIKVNDPFSHNFKEFMDGKLKKKRMKKKERTSLRAWK